VETTRPLDWDLRRLGPKWDPRRITEELAFIGEREEEGKMGMEEEEEE
jgi:hypothetical protein